jgi:hypothetical protein
MYLMRRHIVGGGLWHGALRFWRPVAGWRSSLLLHYGYGRGIDAT